MSVIYAINAEVNPVDEATWDDWQTRYHMPDVLRQPGFLRVTKYKIDDGSFATYTAPVQVTEAGDHVVYFYSVDLAGNIETEKSQAFTVEAPPISITIKGGLGVSVTVKNTGTADLADIVWAINLDGKFIFVGKAKSGTIDALAAGEEVILKDFVVGLGKTGITVAVGDVETTVSGTVLLVFVLGVA